MSKAKRKIDLNTATKDELAELHGVGRETAAAIVRHRKNKGGFASTHDLTKVPGIGPATVATLANHVSVRRSGNGPRRSEKPHTRESHRRTVRHRSTQDEEVLQSANIAGLDFEPSMPPAMQMGQVPAEYARLGTSHLQRRASRYLDLSRRLVTSRTPSDSVRACTTFWNDMANDYLLYWQSIAAAMTHQIERHEHSSENG